MARVSERNQPSHWAGRRTGQLADELQRQPAGMVHAVSGALFRFPPKLSRREGESPCGANRSRVAEIPGGREAPGGKTRPFGNDTERTGGLDRGQFFKAFNARTKPAFE